MAAFAPEFDPDERRPLPYRRVPGPRLSIGGTDDEPEYFLKVPGGPLLVLREQERFLWELLDGTPLFAEIGRRFQARFGARRAPDDFRTFIAELLAAEAVERIAEGESVRKIQLDSGNPATVPSGGGATIGAFPRRQAGSDDRAVRRGGREGKVDTGLRGGRVAKLVEIGDGDHLPRWCYRLMRPDQGFARQGRHSGSSSRQLCAA